MPDPHAPHHDPFPEPRAEAGSASDHRGPSAEASARADDAHDDRQPESIRARFTFHPPTPTRAKHHEAITEACIRLAEAIELACPPCRARSVAITKIEEAKMWANAALAVHGERLVDGAPTTPHTP